MSPQTSLPKYLQISESLIRDIAAGHYPAGSRLPPERDLAVQLGVSVGTLRKALEDLVNKRVIRRRHGSGNYVEPGDALPKSVYGFFRLEMADGGGLPTARILSLDLVPKTEGMAEIGPGPDAWRIRRIRSLNGIDVAAEEIWLDQRYADTLRSEDLSESLYLHYRYHLDLTILRVVDSVGINRTPDWVTGCGLTPGDAAAHVIRESWDQHETRAEVSFTWFNAARARYVSRHK